MTKILKLSREGFTLVELMIVVAIIGILATIAVPQYSKFQAKSKQSEVRIGLGALHTVEQSFFVDNNSYSECLANIGYAREGTKFYYTMGFASDSSVCGPSLNGAAPANTCLSYQWTQTVDPATNAVTAINPVTTATCTAGANVNYFLANQRDKGTMPTQANLPTTAVISLDAANANAPKFIIGAASNLSGTTLDLWTIDQKKEMLNTVSGL